MFPTLFNVPIIFISWTKNAAKARYVVKKIWLYIFSKNKIEWKYDQLNQVNFSFEKWN